MQFNGKKEPIVSYSSVEVLKLEVTSRPAQVIQIYIFISTATSIAQKTKRRMALIQDRYRRDLQVGSFESTSSIALTVNAAHHRILRLYRAMRVNSSNQERQQPSIIDIIWVPQCNIVKISYTKPPVSTHSIFNIPHWITYGGAIISCGIQTYRIIKKCCYSVLRSGLEGVRLRGGAPSRTTSQLSLETELPWSRIIRPPAIFGIMQLTCDMFLIPACKVASRWDCSQYIMGTIPSELSIFQYPFFVRLTEMKALISNYRCHERSITTSRLSTSNLRPTILESMRIPCLTRLIWDIDERRCKVGGLESRACMGFHLETGKLSYAAGLVELMWCTTVNKTVYSSFTGHLRSLDIDRMSLDLWNAHQQVLDADEDWPTTFRKAVVSIPPPSLKIDIGQWVLFDPSPRSSWPSRRNLYFPPAIGVSTSTAPLWVKIVSDATTPGQQPYRHPILRTNPRPSPWSPASTRIPPELFDNILFYLCLDYEFRGRSMCGAISLVCLRWASLCREALFHDKQITIRSSEEVQTFTKYATQGCPSLVPIHTLIKSICVEQRYDMRHSFCDRVYHMLKARFGVRLHSLTLAGPVPEGFPSCKLDTPHWSLPPSVPTPPSLLSYDEITVERVHLPSFRHVVKYVRHFAQAGNIEFEGLTWDADGQEPQLPFSRRNPRKVKDKDLYVCGDPSVLAVSDVMLKFLPYPEESEELPISIVNAGPEYKQNLTFHLCNPTAGNTQTSDVHVVGVTLGVIESKENVDVDSLRENLGHFPMLRVALLLFDSYQGLLAAMECHRPLSFNPRPVNGQGCSYVFTCLRQTDNELFLEVPRANDSGYDYVEIDPITLSPTGRSWAYDGPLSSYGLWLLLTRESLRQTGNIPPAFT
ncbi:hypothetical protein BDY19DRAFT_910691 [Irpex rosettiformis]|uniref:Uncharacterized protein n=1 Tax=Irpex rosettiformis TaxID=378272 RepID=A0ACB8TMU1_9APHY|nr:hypothetical protein BDY19DRAFT_910691 [Irpex rosettiformis]